MMSPGLRLGPPKWRAWVVCYNWYRPEGCESMAESARLESV